MYQFDALKVKNDAVIEVGGDITMSGTMNVDTNTCTATHTVEKAFVASEGYEIVFGGAAGAVTATVNSLNAEEPTEAPTAVPTEVPTEDPTEVPTEAPVVEPTEKPADSTEAPVATENAVVEGSDSSAKDAKGGCGSVVGGVGAVFALMAAAVVVLKKRK